MFPSFCRSWICFFLNWSAFYQMNVFSGNSFWYFKFYRKKALIIVTVKTNTFLCMWRQEQTTTTNSIRPETLEYKTEWIPVLQSCLNAHSQMPGSLSTISIVLMLAVYLMVYVYFLLKVLSFFYGRNLILIFKIIQHIKNSKIVF